jgi:parallel beta-helix repeat protein
MEETSGCKPATVATTLELLAQLGVAAAPEGPPANRRVDTPRREVEPIEVPATPLVVDASGAGTFTSLQEALRKAGAGSRIVVRPGRYEGGLVLTRDVQILGDGPVEEIVVDTPDHHCLRMQTGQALVRGLTLRSRGACKGNQRCAVDIPQGRLVLEDCAISSDTLAGVSIHGPTADPLIQRCRIHDGATSGIVIWDGGRGTISDCDVDRNTVAGILVRTGGNPVV